MKMATAVAGLAAALLCAGALAQTVYESKSGSGKVYSDRPLPGGKPVELKPLNVIEATPAPPPAAAPGAAAAGEAKAGPAPVPYQRFAVVFPEADGSVAANNATFEVRVSIDPPLQVARGHAFVLRMDGRAVPGRYTATEMMVPPEFFGDAIPAGAQRHVIEASVVDGQNAVLMTTPPVSFQTRFVNVLQRPHSLHKPMPRPVPPKDEKAVERPALEQRRN